MSPKETACVQFMRAEWYSDDAFVLFCNRVSGPQVQLACLHMAFFHWQSLGRSSFVGASEGECV